MKTFLILSAFTLALMSCEKSNNAPAVETKNPLPVTEKCGPYGKESAWLSVGGDTIFSDTLTLIYFYTEITTPYNICYYKQNISFWNDYDYTFDVPENTIATDTLIFTDIDSGRKAIFKRKK